MRLLVHQPNLTHDSSLKATTFNINSVKLKTLTDADLFDISAILGNIVPVAGRLHVTSDIGQAIWFLPIDFVFADFVDGMANFTKMLK